MAVQNNPVYHYDKSFMMFGSLARILAGKVPVKEWKTVAEEMWAFAKSKVDELYEADVPHFDPPVSTLPPEPVNGNPEPSLPPPAEKPVKMPDPAPIPAEPLLSPEEQQTFVAYCQKYGMSEIGIQRFLKDQGLTGGVANIPLRRAKNLCVVVRDPKVSQKYQ